MARNYKMHKRAEAQGEIRERILRATMSVHDEKGVAPTTYGDVAERAGVGVATVYRHFPKIGDLIMACGGHVWAEMQPPTPETAATTFAGVDLWRERLVRLVEELDAFYERGSFRLALASRDRALVPEVHAFLTAVEAGTEALVREALAPEALPEATIRVALALLSFPAWQAFRRQHLSAGDTIEAQLRLLNSAIGTPARA
jgi:AcrR family transcriptional regulator